MKQHVQALLLGAGQVKLDSTVVVLARYLLQVRICADSVHVDLQVDLPIGISCMNQLLACAENPSALKYTLPVQKYFDRFFSQRALL